MTHPWFRYDPGADATWWPDWLLSGPWSRLLLRVGGYRPDHWWHSWSWRFER